MVPLIGILQRHKVPPRHLKVEQAEFMDLMIFTPPQQKAPLEVQGLLLQGQNWVPRLLPLPQAVYNRIYTRKSTTANQLEMGSDRVFNTITQLDKWKVGQILQASAIKEYLPKTRLYSWQTMAPIFQTGRTTIIKPRHGHLGHEIYLLQRRKSSWQLLKGSYAPFLRFKNEKEAKKHFLTRFGQSKWLLQEFISGALLQDRIFDLRYLLQKGSLGNWAVTGRLARVALKGYFVTNICKTILPVEKLLSSTQQTKLEEISLQAAQILDGPLGHLGEISVDFILDDQKKPWIIEVNGLPAKELFFRLKEPPTLQKIYRFPLDYAYHLATSLK